MKRKKIMGLVVSLFIVLAVVSMSGCTSTTSSTTITKTITETKTETKTKIETKTVTKTKTITRTETITVTKTLTLTQTQVQTTKGRYYYTCPADKYKLTTEDFKESGWRIKNTDIDSIENMWKNRGISVENYQCKAGEEVIDASLFLYVYRYGIYVFSSEDTAQKEFTKIKEAYLEKGSVGTYSVGDEGFIYDLGLGMAYDVWIRENNIIVGIYTNGDLWSLDEFIRGILFEKLHNVGG